MDRCSLSTLLVFVLLLGIAATECPSCQTAQLELSHQLSTTSSVSCGSPSRWSEYGAPNASVSVQVGAEEDVAITVGYANSKNCAFLAQNGGNGWSTTFTLNQSGILIDLSDLNHVSVDIAHDQAMIQGGANVSTVVSAAYQSRVRVATSTCNCVGFLGAALGGGLSRTMGLYGIGTDQLVSAKMVTANGTLLYVDDKTDSDLWYAIRGAGPNFGIITSAIIKTYPIPPSDNIAWTGTLAYTSDKIEALVQVINNLTFLPTMSLDFGFATTGPPDYAPVVLALPFYVGNASAGRAAFAPLLALNASSDDTSVVPYNQWNTFTDSTCARGGRKPAYGASMTQITPSTWRGIFNAFSTFVVKYPGTGNTSVLLECYSTAKSVAIGETAQGKDSSYPFRALRFHGTVYPWYADPDLDEAANAFGAQVRDLWREGSGLKHNHTYINFAHGDEPLGVVYGTSLPRLQTLKKKYDPSNQFSQWFPLL